MRVLETTVKKYNALVFMVFIDNRKSGEAHVSYVNIIDLVVYYYSHNITHFSDMCMYSVTVGPSAARMRFNRKSYVVLERNVVLPVVRGLMSLILKANFSCHTDMFILACKVCTAMIILHTCMHTHTYMINNTTQTYISSFDLHVLAAPLITVS